MPNTLDTIPYLLLFLTSGSEDVSYLFTGLKRNRIGPSNKGLDKSPRFV